VFGLGHEALRSDDKPRFPHGQQAAMTCDVPDIPSLQPIQDAGEAGDTLADRCKRRARLARPALARTASSPRGSTGKPTFGMPLPTAMRHSHRTSS
jgi:hypothetical protein